VYLSHVWRRQPFNPWTSFIVVIFVATGRLIVHADNPTQSQDGYKVSSVNADGKTVQVKEADPYRSVKSAPVSDGKYHPEEVNFGATSSMANKKFDVPSDGLTKADPDFINHGQDTFTTKPYAFNTSSTPISNLDSKTAYQANNTFDRSAAGFDKNYATSKADAGQDRTATLDSSTPTATEQDRTAVLGGGAIPTFPDTLGDKKFEGPEADAVHRHLKKASNGQILITDIPDRPLTIDEVRDLINHGFKPNTDAPPPEPSKPLNDPDYKPVPLRDTPPPDNDDDKNDPVPPPGTMAAPPAPENSEPLPQP
jgi:hypothetical protein